MDAEQLQAIFEEKYENKLGISFGQWLENAPQSEAAAYKRLNEIDVELNRTYDTWFEAKSEEKNQLEDYRDKLKAEYDLLEELFGLEAKDKEW
ncbi:MAG: hypothetical protein NTX98_02830 [Candidatus Doudnabacteria bacterium]|nr:hypothetical protein [Candidatus Doudnabacteria bacterium]